MEHHKPIDQDDEYDYLFKIVLIGDAGVGKTCIVQRFRSGTFIERHGSTIGVDFTMKTLHLDGKRIKVSTFMFRDIIKGKQSYMFLSEFFLGHQFRHNTCVLWWGYDFQFPCFYWPQALNVTIWQISFFPSDKLEWKDGNNATSSVNAFVINMLY